MAERVYFSGPDYDVPETLWGEEGELPPCVETLRTGDFLCNCGQHRVIAEITLDPLDSQERITRTVIRL